MIHNVLHHSSAEFLAKQDGYSQPDLDYYLVLASKILAGDTDGIDDKLINLLKLHELMIYDREFEAIRISESLASEAPISDARQIKSTKGRKNLDFFRANGVDYIFDEAQIDRVLSLVNPTKPLTECLMRENIVSSSGFENVRLNYIYHDVLDHVWLFELLEEEGFRTRYSDFLDSIGDPFSGSLLSRESELISGIGFTSRRYLADQAYFGQLSLDPIELADFLATSSKAGDERIANALRIILPADETSRWAGFVVKDTIANVVSQRVKRGAVKKLSRDDSGDFVSTGEIMPIFDPLYLSFMVEAVGALAERKGEYINAQVELNLRIENALIEYVKTGKSAGRLSLGQCVSTEGIAEHNLNVLRDNIGLSTSYFERHASVKNNPS